MIVKALNVAVKSATRSSTLPDTPNVPKRMFGQTPFHSAGTYLPETPRLEAEGNACLKTYEQIRRQCVKGESLGKGSDVLINQKPEDREFRT